MDESASVGEVSAEGADSRRAKRKCLIILLTIAVCGGFLEGYFPEDGFIPLWFLEIGMSLSTVIVAMVWCYIDAGERGFTISFRLSLLLFLLLIVGFLYYILKTRCNREAIKTLGLAALFCLLFYTLSEISYQLGIEVYWRYGA